MTTEELCGEATKLLKAIPKEDQAKAICTFSGYWIPLNFFYLDSVRSGELVALNKTPREQRLRYWEAIKKYTTDSKYAFSIASALYVWEAITNEEIK